MHRCPSCTIPRPGLVLRGCPWGRCTHVPSGLGGFQSRPVGLPGCSHRGRRGGAASLAWPAPRECGRLSGPPVSPAPQWRGCCSLCRGERGVRCPHARTLEQAAGGTRGAGVLSCSWCTCQSAALWKSARLSPRFRCQNSGPLGPLHRGSAPSTALQVRLVPWAAATAREAVGQSDGSACTPDPCPVPQPRTGPFPTLPFPECLRN